MTSEVSEQNSENILTNGLPGRVGQIFVNLLDNAMTFSMRVGTVKISLEKNAARDQ